jgi:glutathione S-transferase
MKIFWFKAQAPLRVLALAKHLNIKAEFIEIDMMNGKLKSAEYAGLNPNMKAPTLVDGEIVLWESSAIMAYLCIKVESDMWPARIPLEQVEVLRWLSWTDSHWSKSVSEFYFEYIVKSTFKLGEPDKEACRHSIPDLMKFAKVLDAHLAGHDFLACGRLTIADFCAASMARYWRESEMPIGEFKNIVRWLSRLNEIPAWAEPWPDSKYV